MWGKGRPADKADNLTAIYEPTVQSKCGSLDVSQPYGPSRTVTRITSFLPVWTKMKVTYEDYWNNLKRNLQISGMRAEIPDSAQSDPTSNTLLIGMLPANTNHIPDYSWHKTLRLQSPDIHAFPESGYELMTWQTSERLGSSLNASPLLKFCD
jgi:hypothetical protein